MTNRFPWFSRSSLYELRRRLMLDDLVFLPCALALVWPFFWNIPFRPLAWSLAIISSALITSAYVQLRPAEERRAAPAFWIIVGLPLAIVYLSRMAFPDVSFDVLNYHIFHGERALHGPLLTSGDFFPTAAPFNPVADILTAGYRHILGYRLGTVANLLATIWLGLIIDRFLARLMRRSWRRAIAGLLVLTTEQIFFQINNYMVDLLALPFLLQATALAVSKPEPDQERRRLTTIAFLLGISVTFKLANLAFALPIVLICFFNLFQQRRKLSPGQFA